MRRVLVTGVTGFAGSHLVDYMLSRGDCEIFGIQRWRSPTENIEHFMDRITLVECDLRDASSARDMLETVRPEWIFHLAAQSFVPTSWSAPTESLMVFELGAISDPQTTEQLIQGVRTVREAVELAVTDWKKKRCAA